MRIASLAFLALVTCLALFASPAAAARPFPETGYSVTNESFLNYFDHRGGVRTLGYPISRDFDLLGTRVQFFQRAVLQAQADGGVGLLNILDAGLLPYTAINGSSFPAPDPAITQVSPNPADPDYGTRAVDFVRAFAPDGFEGMPVNFYSTFASTVSLADAFPAGGGNEALLPLLNLEIWGLPTSRPTYDPANRDFVYLRFQRGIMHYDRSSGLTQGILIGDYLKSVITGSGLPADLGAQAAPSPLFRQYDNARPGGLARPEALAGTNMFAAFERDGVVVAAPVPATPTPVVPTPVPATPTPAPPAATPTPAAPAAIELIGPPQFTNVIMDALNLLSTKSSSNYALVRQNVYRIALLESGTANTDLAGRTLNFDEESAYVREWYGMQDQQTQWVAGEIVHNAVHIAQFVRGAPTTGADAEMEALLRQQETLRAIETTANPPYQFVDFVQKAITNNTGWFGHYFSPPGPQDTDEDDEN